MIRSFCFIVVYMLTLASAQAQAGIDTVNRKQVELAVNDASLTSFYPALLDRFNAFDSTLTQDEYRLLYYGFVFQPGYSLGSDHRKKEMNDALRAADYAAVIRIADSVLANIPVSLAALYFRAYAMMYKDESDSSYLKYTKRYAGLRDAILSSGDGKQCSSAFKVIFIEDEYEIMFRGFEIDINVSQTFQNPCDRFVVSPSGTYPNTEIYFDTSESVRLLRQQLNLR